MGVNNQAAFYLYIVKTYYRPTFNRLAETSEYVVVLDKIVGSRLYKCC